MSTRSSGCSAAENSNSQSRSETAADTTSESHTETQSRTQSRGLDKRTWYFTFDLQASDEGVVSQLQAFESSKYRQQSLSRTSIISFSIGGFGADGSPDNASDITTRHIKGFISGGTMYESSVKKWLTNSAISNLELNPISNRFHDPLIISFLKESALPGAVPGLPAAGESAIQGCRLRVDTMKASDTPRVMSSGRPRKRTNPLECEVGAGSVPSLLQPPQQHQLQLGALPAPAPIPPHKKTAC